MEAEVREQWEWEVNGKWEKGRFEWRDFNYGGNREWNILRVKKNKERGATNVFKTKTLWEVDG